MRISKYTLKINLNKVVTDSYGPMLFVWIIFYMRFKL